MSTKPSDVINAATLILRGAFLFKNNLNYPLRVSLNFLNPIVFGSVKQVHKLVNFSSRVLQSFKARANQIDLDQDVLHFLIVHLLNPLEVMLFVARKHSTV
jgi:hypothetical protein